jgi:hypothetical protein
LKTVHAWSEPAVDDDGGFLARYLDADVELHDGYWMSVQM